MAKVLVIGEILIDKIINKNTNNETLKIGGAPFNFAYNLACLGIDTTFVGQVGDDKYGDFILENIQSRNNLKLDIRVLKNVKTSIAEARVSGENVEYRFIRDNTSDYKFDFESLMKIDFREYDLVHLGGLMLSDQETYENLTKLIDKIKDNKIPLSFDINLRLDIYKNSDIAFKRISKIVDYIDILKTSKEEFLWIYQIKDIDEFLNKNKVPSKIIFVTDGAYGAYAINKNEVFYKPSYSVDSIEFVGCGDSFFAGAIEEILCGKRDFCKILEFSNATGALTSMVIGAIKAYENKNDVLKFIDYNKHQNIE